MEEKRDLLLVIDMQNVYNTGGQWACPNTQKAGAKIQHILEEIQQSYRKTTKSSVEHSGDSEHPAHIPDFTPDIIFTRFLANEVNPQGVWKDYNRENVEVNHDAYANAMIDSIDFEGYPLYTKSTYSSLEIPEVREAAIKAKRVVVAGVVAECCVLATVMALIDLGAYVIYLTDAVAGIDSSTEAAVETILAGLEPLHVRRMTTEEYLTLLYSLIPTGKPVGL